VATSPLSARATANARLLEQIPTPASPDESPLRGPEVVAGAADGIGSPGCERQHGLMAQRARRFRMLHERHEFAPPAPNRLQQVFVAPAVNRIWAGDLTAIATRAGWLYLAVVLDLYSRRVIGWAMSAKPDQHVALQALHMALGQRCPRPGLGRATREICLLQPHTVTR
jgi:hypothetical protein